MTAEPMLPSGGPRLRQHPVPVAEVIIVTAGCPSCGGAWVRELSMDHQPGCAIGRAEDARANADAVIGADLGRWATPAEVTIGRALGLEVAEDAVMALQFITPSIRRRLSLGSFDLDRLATADELPAPATPTAS